MFEQYKVNPNEMKRIASCLLALLTTGIASAQRASDAINLFAIDLYRNLDNDRTKNIVFSPLSIAPAFGMVTLGARGETLNQLNRTFHFGKGADFHKSIGRLQNSILESSTDSVIITITNKAWLQKDYKTLSSYRKSLKKSYKVQILQVDFIQNPEGSRQTINLNIEADTRGHIKNLLPEGSISTLTRLVLTNAIYFKGKWAQPFDPSKTSERNFYASTGKPTKHPFMTADKTFNLAKGDNYTAVELDYKDSKLSLIILLPSEETPIDEFEKRFTNELYREITANLQPQKVLVFLPKFTIDYGFALKKILTPMGLTLPFSDNADFTGISGNKDLKISDAFHKAFIEVSEEGTTAAAATAVVVAMKSMPNFNVFDANRPFMFILRHKTTNTILFIGRFASPK